MFGFFKIARTRSHRIPAQRLRLSVGRLETREVPAIVFPSADVVIMPAETVPPMVDIATFSIVQLSAETVTPALNSDPTLAGEFAVPINTATFDRANTAKFMSVVTMSRASLTMARAGALQADGISSDSISDSTDFAQKAPTSRFGVAVPT
jgi:hypothetical protein